MPELTTATTMTSVDVDNDYLAAVNVSEIPDRLEKLSPAVLLGEILKSLRTLADPGGDHIPFWDESANAAAWLQIGTGLNITGTTLNSASGISIGNEIDDATTFNDLIGTAGGDPGTIYHGIVTADFPISTAYAVPSNLFLDFVKGVVITDGGGGEIDFEGVGLLNPLSQPGCPYFSGFATGDITWSSANAYERPAEISVELWDTGNLSLTDRLRRVNGAFGTEYVRIAEQERGITAETQFQPNKEIVFAPGVYTSTFVPAIGNYYMFGLHSNTHFHGPRNAIIEEAPTVGGGRIIGPSEIDLQGMFDIRRNIVVEGLTIQGNPSVTPDGSGSNILMGNCHQSAIKDVFFDSVHFFSAVLGGSGTTGNYAYDSDIIDCVFRNAPNQAIAALNCKNCRILYNLIDTTGSGQASGAMIDCEPNAPTDNMDDMLVGWNIISATDPHDVGFTNVLGGIVVQAAGGIVHAKGNRVVGNRILGRHPSEGFDTRITFGIYLYGCVDAQSEDNYVRNAFQGSYRYFLCRDLSHHGSNRSLGSTTASGFDADVSVWACSDSVIRDHTAQEVEEYASATGINELEWFMAATSSTDEIAIQEGYRLFDFNIGKDVFFNGTVYEIDDYDTATETLTATVSVGTVIPKTFVAGDINTGTDTINETAHGYQTGCIGKLSNSGGALPTFATSPSSFPSEDGLKHWYVIRVDADNFKLAITLEDALANNPSDITAAGSGTHTFTPEMQTRFSNNLYINNWAPGGILLAPTGTSQIVSTAHDNQIELVDNTNVTVPTRGGIYNFINISTPRTATLPDARYCRGLTLGFVDAEGTASTHNLTIDGFSSQTVGGAANAVLTEDYEAIRVQSDGANWQIVSRTAAPAAGGPSGTTLLTDYLTSHLSLVSSSTMANTSISLDVEVGTYHMEMAGFMVNGPGGFKCDFDAGTCTLTDFRVAYTSQKLNSSPASASGDIAASRAQDFPIAADSGVVYSVRGSGMVEVDGAGTFILRAAQFSSDATETLVIKGLSVILTPLT